MSAACIREVPNPGGSWGYEYVPCPRLLTTDAQRDAGLCGQHLAGQRRREASERAEAEREERRTADRQAAEGAVLVLGALGVHAVARMDGGVPYLALTLDDAAELAARLAALPTRPDTEES